MKCIKAHQCIRITLMAFESTTYQISEMTTATMGIKWHLQTMQITGALNRITYLNTVF